jgi:SpoVK/Ycf46/Vps4 family AAA+-type ATPase
MSIHTRLLRTVEKVLGTTRLKTDKHRSPLQVKQAVNSVKAFLARRDRYEECGLIYKRGVLLWGPEGSDKGVIIAALVEEVVAKHDGIHLSFGRGPELMEMELRQARQKEPDRPIIVILEDIDEIIAKFGEAILGMLDGENRIANVVYVATTNHPERLGARIVNRPSRFDERILVA